MTRKPTLILEKRAEDFDSPEDMLLLREFEQIRLHPSGLEEDYGDGTRLYHIKGATVMLTKDTFGPWKKGKDKVSFRTAGVRAEVYSDTYRSTESAKRILIEQGYKLRGRKHDR